LLNGQSRVEHFLEKYQYLNPAKVLSVDADVISALAQLELPGNARQLENMVRWALVNKDDETALNLRDLPFEIWQQLSEQRKRPSEKSKPAAEGKDIHPPPPEIWPQDLPSPILRLLDSNGWNLSRALQDCERLLLEAAFHQVRGNQSQMARLLGITPRSIYNKVRKYHLHQKQ
jgi:DNA-binding NtrC family response regulator